MKIILVFVSTLDGKITKWGDPFVRAWSSVEDQHYFSKIRENSSLIVIGSNTYNADMMKPSPKHLLLVLTRHPEQYIDKKSKGRLEFTNETPVQLVTRLKTSGHKQMLVAGGAQIATSFLKVQLIDELWLTIEPKIFGSGANFVSEEKLDIKLQLLSSEKINKQGTLINKYKVIREPGIKTK